jgi:anti-sigma regulatory factor (Ser/Thr protein kinase)
MALVLTRRSPTERATAAFARVGDHRTMVTMHESVADRPVRIAIDADVLGARSAVRRCAQGLGFAAKEVAELVIVVSELASNILKHAGRGSIVVEAVNDPRNGAGIRITAADTGPAFRDLGMALRDGCCDAGPILPERLLGRKGIGSGLGAVVRFTDTFECDELPVGKRIHVVRFRRRPRRSKRAPPR